MAVQHFFNAGRLLGFIGIYLLAFVLKVANVCLYKEGSENFFSFYFVFSIISFNFAP